MKGSKKGVSIGKDSENGVIDLIQNVVSNENVAKDPFFVLVVCAVASRWKWWKDNLPNFRPYYRQVQPRSLPSWCTCHSWC